MRRTLIATALLSAFALAGCGGQQSDTGVASVAVGNPSGAAASASPTATADQEEQGRKFAQCMRENGVAMDDPDPNGGGGLKEIAGETDKTKLRKALEACREYAPSKLRGGINGEDVEQLRQLAQCMRENGVDMPDPNPDGTFPSGTMSKVNRRDAKFEKALETCNKRIPKPGATK
ncbi:hypothetical protein ACFLIM_49325 [Nonomuraea sp. M3C6]|uniref:Secreted protein n=1 Tax=Nonomuraea marmarensis TaxID=3351344 RepID=A0ABW7AUT2_9ACTN